MPSSVAHALTPAAPRTRTGWTEPFAHPAVQVAMLALTYVVTAELGLRLAYDSHNVTAVWPPTAVAIVAFLFLGTRLWPGVLAGALIANVANGASLPTGAAISVGNTLAPLAVVLILRRLDFHRGLDRLRDPILLVATTAICMGISATLGTVSLYATGAGGVEPFGSTWLVWWVGDVMGVILLAPLALTAIAGEGPAPFFRRAPESVALLCATIAIAFIGFSTTVPVSYLAFILWVWAMLRFGSFGAAAMIAVTASIGITRTVASQGPFSHLPITDALLSVQAFNAALAVMSLITAAVLRERARAVHALASAANELEVRVEARTTELAASERRLIEVQGLAHIGSWHWDIYTDHVSWTDELYRIYGLDPQAFPATFAAYLERVHPEHLQQVRAAVEHAFKTGVAYEHEYRIVRPNGEIRWVHARGEVVRDPVSGSVAGLRGYCQDITERRRSEDALRMAFEREREAGDQLRALDETKDALLMAVSHELRTPLTVVLGVASTMRRPGIDPGLKDDLLARLEVNANRLDRLLRDLLDLDRLTRGVVEPRRRPVHIASLVSRVLAALELETHPVEVDVDVPSAYVDPSQMERILENLLANAAKHTPPGTQLWVRAWARARGVELAVDDAGPGVSDAIKAAIFEPFRQGPRPAHAPGTGIGLALVHRFALLHGGRAWVEDRPGGGASFRVSLGTDEEPGAQAV